MATGAEIDRLVEGVLSGRIDRRQLMTAAAALGIAVPGALAMRAAPAMAQEASPTPKSGGTLTAIIVDDPNFLDILVTQLAQVRNMMESVYDTLTYLDAADPTFAIKGRLAKEWRFPEELEFELKLHEGVKFHDGEDFTADDVKWTIEYVKNPDTGSPNATFLEPVDSVEVIDPLTVRFNLNKPWAALPVDLSTIQIYSKSATADSIATTPNGTGPFVWKEWVPGDHITITKNPNYWIPGEPYLDEIVFRPIKEKATSLAVMQAGDADVFFTPELKDKATIDGDPNLKSIPSLLNDSGYILYLNNGAVPMNDQNIRLAAPYALDRTTYFQAFLAGQGEKNTSPWTKTLWAYNPINDTAFEYDLDKAKEYLTPPATPTARTPPASSCPSTSSSPRAIRSGSRARRCSRRRWTSWASRSRSRSSSWPPGSTGSSRPTNTTSPGTTTSSAPSIRPTRFRSPSSIPRDRRTSAVRGRHDRPDRQGGTTLDQDERKEFYFQFQERWNELATASSSASSRSITRCRRMWRGSTPIHSSSRTSAPSG